MTQFVLSEGIIFGLGNPLLDISCNADNEFLKKYGLFANNSILAEEKHKTLCNEMIEKYKVEYFAGGSVQNTLRVTQWFFKDQPNYATYMGAIGDDQFGKQMHKKAKENGVNAIYMIVKKERTGTCACLITSGGKNRSLCAYLGASQFFREQHLLDNYQYIEKAKVFFASGYHLAVSLESILNLAKHVAKNPGKVFCFSLSATYIIEKYSKQFLEVFPYIDLLFGNDSEARQFSELMGWESYELREITGKIANKDTELKKTGRKVIITQGKGKVFFATTSNSDIKEFEVSQISDKKVVDTNGAGDAFVGGFFAQFIQNESIEICIKSAIYAATQVIQHSGCSFPKENKFQK
jgi:adenosine kinase